MDKGVSEKGAKREVDEILRSRLFFRVIGVDSAEERKIFEEKVIATISACPVCRPSEKWLGNVAWSEKVRRSRLWNSNFVDSPARLTEEDLRRLEQLVFETLLLKGFKGLRTGQFRTESCS